MSVFRKLKGKRITAKHKDWRKGTWYVWKRVNGKIIHKAIPLAQTKEEAEAAEREIIRRAFNQTYGLPDGTTTFREFAEGKYKQYVEQHNVNKVSKYQYIRLLTDRFKSCAIAQVTPQDLRNAQAEWRKKYSASSVNLIMSTASKIFTLACQEGILDRNPMQYVTRLKEPPPRNRLLTKEEKERLWLVLAGDNLLYRLVVLAVNLPLRRGQLLAISPDAIDAQNGFLLAGSSKGRVSRAIPVNATALRTLEAMQKDGQLPFPLKETGVRKRWVKALKRARIENFRFHDLRKEMATDLRRKGVHSKVIQDLYGHSSMKITDVYLPPQFEDMRAAVETLDEKVMDGGVQ